jgi:3',5'-cyclic AMP phosphodiesterase CpdA
MQEGHKRTTERMQPGARRAFVFAQLSDPHLSSLTGVQAGELLNKRMLGYLSWRHRRRDHHRREVLDALVADLHAQRPDHVVVTGDLTHIGLTREFQEVREWLSSMGLPQDVSVIPGNHDAYIATPWERSFGIWSAYMSSDPGVGSADVFPTLRVRGPVAFIGVSSARPSAPFMAVGTVGHRQLERLDELLAETARRGLFRAVLIHHPPLPGSEKWRKRLTDSAEFCAVLRRRGAEVVLHGHSHASSRALLETDGAAVPVIGAASASAAHGDAGRRASYHLYEIVPMERGWDVCVSVRGYGDGGSGFRSQDEYRLDSA